MGWRTVRVPGTVLLIGAGLVVSVQAGAGPLAHASLLSTPASPIVLSPPPIVLGTSAPALPPAPEPVEVASLSDPLPLPPAPEPVEVASLSDPLPLPPPPEPVEVASLSDPLPPPLPPPPEPLEVASLSEPLPLPPPPEPLEVASLSDPLPLPPAPYVGLTSPGVVLAGAESGVAGVGATVLEASRVVSSPAGVATSDPILDAQLAAAAVFGGAPGPCPAPASSACTVLRPRLATVALQVDPTSSGGSSGDGGILGGGLAGTGARVGLLAAAGALLVWAGHFLARVRGRR